MLGDLAERYGPIYKFRVLHLHVGTLCNPMTHLTALACSVQLQPCSLFLSSLLLQQDASLFSCIELLCCFVSLRNRDRQPSIYTTSLKGACLRTGGLHYRPGTCYGHPEKPAC